VTVWHAASNTNVSTAIMGATKVSVASTHAYVDTMCKSRSLDEVVVVEHALCNAGVGRWKTTCSR